jgi:hypothetical protein
MNDFSMDMDVTIDLTGQAGQIMTLEKTMFLLLPLFKDVCLTFIDLFSRYCYNLHSMGIYNCNKVIAV